MEIVEDVRTARGHWPHVVLTIGSFDGVHIGHRSIIEQVKGRAAQTGGTSAVLTLTPHPRYYFAPENPPLLLTSDAKKAALFEEAGVQVLFYLPFNAETAALEREAFLDEIICKCCGAQEVVVGHDFRFGRNAKGNYDWLCEVADSRGLTVSQVEPVLLHGERVSSTRIRELLSQGDCEGAAHMLGRPYSLAGEVVAGRGLGRELGFPTANVRPHHSALPADGIYAAQAVFDGERHLAAVNVGFAPTLRQAERTVEAYILDFAGDLVGRHMEIVFHKRLRPEQKFDGVAALVAAIDHDVQSVREFFHKVME